MIFRKLTLSIFTIVSCVFAGERVDYDINIGWQYCSNRLDANAPSSWGNNIDLWGYFVQLCTTISIMEKMCIMFSSDYGLAYRYGVILTDKYMRYDKRDAKEHARDRIYIGSLASHNSSINLGIGTIFRRSSGKSLVRLMFGIKAWNFSTDFWNDLGARESDGKEYKLQDLRTIHSDYGYVMPAIFMTFSTELDGVVLNIGTNLSMTTGNYMTVSYRYIASCSSTWPVWRAILKHDRLEWCMYIQALYATDIVGNFGLKLYTSMARNTISEVEELSGCIPWWWQDNTTGKKLKAIESAQSDYFCIFSYGQVVSMFLSYSNYFL